MTSAKIENIQICRVRWWTIIEIVQTQPYVEVDSSNVVDREKSKESKKDHRFLHFKDLSLQRCNISKFQDKPKEGMLEVNLKKPYQSKKWSDTTLSTMCL